MAGTTGTLALLSAAVLAVACGGISDTDGLGTHACDIILELNWVANDLQIVHTDNRMCPVALQFTHTPVSVSTFVVDPNTDQVNHLDAWLEARTPFPDSILVGGSTTSPFMPRSGFSWAAKLDMTYTAATGLVNQSDELWFGVNERCCQSITEPWAKQRIDYDIGGGGGGGGSPPGGPANRVPRSGEKKGGS